MNRCLACLKPIERPQRTDEYHDTCLRRVFDTVAVEPKLGFGREAVFVDFRGTHTKRMSISGVQPKLMMSVENGKVVPVTERGRYILKPSPEGYKQAAENEHLSMLLGEVVGIPTPPCALLRFQGGELTYIVRRFDRDGDKKIPQEDMAQVLAIARDSDGEFKYSRSYEEVAQTIHQVTGGVLAVVLRFYERLLFNYLIKNGDYHLKNISLTRRAGSGSANFTDLTPNYDSLNTSLYTPGERALALDLLRDGAITPAYEALGHYTRSDFEELGRRIGLNAKTVDLVISKLLKKKADIESLVSASFLTEDMKQTYVRGIDQRARSLMMRHPVAAIPSTPAP